MTVLDDALALAAANIPCFPCVLPSKRPATQNGFKDATVDVVVLKRWFGKGGYPLIGVPTGSVSGFDAVDLDPRHGSDDWLAKHGKLLGYTRVHGTKSGGEHYLLKHAEGVRNSAGRIAKGVDVRGDGGYIVWWPAFGCDVLNNDVPLADLPEWKPELLTLATTRPASERLQGGFEGTTEGGSAMLAAVLAAIGAASEGDRHTITRDANWQLAGWINAGLLDEHEAYNALLDAQHSASGRKRFVEDWPKALSKAPPIETDQLGAIDDEENDSAEVEVDFRDMLQRGAPKPNGDPGPILCNELNAEIIFRYAPVWKARYRLNLFTSRNELDGRPWEDIDLIRSTIWCQGERLPMNQGMARFGMLMAASANAYHPIRDYLNGLAWDGVSRADTWLLEHVGAEDTALNRAFGVKFLVGLVARVYRPGCKLDTALIFEGRQGLKKSTIFRSLCGNPTWFMGALGDVTKKDTLEKIQGKWIVEEAELDGMVRSEVSATKAFMSTEIDTFRASYAREAKDYPRQGVLVGTVNPGSTGYLKDETGARRFWPVKCAVGWSADRQIDSRQLEAVRDQLLAEAVELFNSGAVWWLDTVDLDHAQAEVADQRFEVDAWEQHAVGHLETVNQTTAGELLTFLGLPIKDQSQQAARRAGAILKRLGWSHKPVRIDGKLHKRFVSPHGERGGDNVVQIDDCQLGALQG